MFESGETGIFEACFISSLRSLWKLFSSLTFLNSACCNSNLYFHFFPYYLLPFYSYFFIPVFSILFLFFFFLLFLYFLFSLVAFSLFSRTLLLFHFFFRFSYISLIFFCCSFSPSIPLLLSVLLRYSPLRSTSSLLNTTLHPSPIRSETPSSRIAAASSAYRSYDIT